MFGFLDIPWAHLLYDRAEIKKKVVESGNPANEIDNIMNSLNSYSLKDYIELLKNSDLKILHLKMDKLDIRSAVKSKEFYKLKNMYSEEELLTRGITVLLKKY